MPSELMHRLNGTVAQRRGDVPIDRHTRQAGQHIVNEVRLAGLQVDGSLALGAHIMDGARELDLYRRQLGGDDPGLQMLLSEIEATAIRQCQRVQAGLFRNQCFGL